MKIKNLVNADFYLDNWKPKILLFKRGEDKKKVVEEVDDYKPYIYCNLEDENGLREMFGRDIYTIEKTEKKYIKDNDKELIKVTLNNPIAIWKIKEYFKTHESDILYPQKYVIDNISGMETTTQLRVNMFDIETTSVQGFPNYLKPVEKIISISAYDNYLDKFFLWIWHKDYENEVEQTVEENEVGGETIKENQEIRRFTNEKDMLNSFLDFMVETKPDILTSWHISFDMSYLFARLEALNLDFIKLSPLYGSKYQDKFYKGLAYWKNGPGVYGKRFGTSEKEKHVYVVGLTYFDLLTAYKNILGAERPSWKLDDVAQEQLKMGKSRTHFDIGKEWEKNPKFIEQYNYVDVLILKHLDAKMGILQRYDTIKNKAFLYNVNDVFSSSKVLDGYVLKKYKDEFVFPSRNYGDDVSVEVAGGFVRKTNPGVYKNVAVFDFAGYYPNLMKTFNLAGEKLIEQDIIQLDKQMEETEDVEEMLKDKMYEFDEETKQIVYKIRTDKFAANLKYDIGEMGTMPSSVEEFMQLRKSYKTEMKKFPYGSVEFNQWHNAQFSMKFLINASYGVSAFPGYRLFKQNNANAITGFARMGSKFLSHKLIENGWDVIYNDTDSCMVQLHTDNLDDNLKEINEEIQPLINKLIDEFIGKFLPEEYAKKHTLAMDCEKIYDSFLLLDVKKRYCGFLTYYDGEKVDNMFHYMGLDSKKSNTILISKEAALDLAKTVLTDGDVEECMTKYYKRCKDSDDVELFKMSSKLEKPQEEYKTLTPAVKAANWSNANLGTKFRAGTKFYILYVEGLSEKQIAFEDVNQLKGLDFKIDKNKYMGDVYNKFSNLIRGIPKYQSLNEQLYYRILTSNTSLSQYF